MTFNPEDENEVIREAISHKLDRPLVKPSKIIKRLNSN